MTQPLSWPILDDIAQLRRFTARLETQLLGVYLTGDAAVTVIEIADRLKALTMPTKGHLAGPLPAAEIGDAA